MGDLLVRGGEFIPRFFGDTPDDEPGGEDWAFEQYLHEKAEQDALIDGRIWTMRDGTHIKVDDMATSHVQKALAMLKRKGFVGPSTVKFCLFSPGPQGEIAKDAFEQECSEVFDAPIHAFVDIFEDEL